MAVQVIKIVYDTDTSDLDRADKALADISAEEKKVAANAKTMSDAIKKGANDAKTSTNSLNSSIKNVGVTIAAAFTVQAIIGFGKEVINIRAQFEKLEAVLTNTLGSKSLARVALAELTELAAKTNFGVLELTQSFVKLANSGFKPTSDELMNLADVANSTGKTFDMLSEAIIDAQTGEFERLKEFGIRASKQGDEVRFTFKGVETQVKFTNEAIRNYIVGLGDLNGVQGATEAISKTLEGRISNLGDSFDQFLNVLGERSAPVIGAVIGYLGSLVDAATDAAKSLDQALEERNTEALKQGINADKEELDTLIEIYELAGLKTTEATQRATDDIIIALNMRRASLIQNGKDINSIEVKQYTTRIESLEKFYEDLLNKAEKANEDELKAAKKKRDEDYKNALSDLNEKEQLAIRKAKVEDMSNVYILDLERKFNQERVALFKKYNQENLNELADYKLRFKENLKETNEAVEDNVIKYKQIQTKKIDIDKGIDKSRIDSNIDTLDKITKAEIEAINKKKKADEDAEKEKKRQREAAINDTIDGLQGLYGDLENLQKKKLQNESNNNERQRDRELSMVKDNKEAQAVINAEYDNKSRELKRRQAKEDKRQAEFNIVINAAQAVSKTLASGGYFAIPLSVVVGGLALAQLAIAESEPEPTFAKGGFTGKGKGTPDQTGERRAGIVHEEEFVFDKHKTAAFRPMFEAIHRNELKPEDFAPKYTAEQIDYMQMQLAMKGAIKDLPVNKFSFDEKGFTHHLHTSNKKTEFKNKRYSSK